MLLSLRGITKNFGAAKALRYGNLEVREGEIHLLMGENGAAKSTLMKIVAGLHRRDAGEMLWHGEPLSFARPSEAAAQGIAMVHQESLLAPHLTGAENIFLGRESAKSRPRVKLGWIERRASVAARSMAFVSMPRRVEKLTPPASN